MDTKSSDLEAQSTVLTAEKSNEYTADMSEYDVFWEEPASEDPENPMNWSSGRKWTIIGMVSFITFLTPLASSMFAPGITQVLEDFGTTSNLLSSFVVSVYVLGFAFGPLVVAPVSEYSGRAWVYNVCNVLFVVFNIASAVAPNMASLVVFRFLDGFAGVAAITCGSGTIADLVPREKRGQAMAIWSMGPLFGPIIGPVVGGFLVEATNWRWVFWVLSITGGVASIVFFFAVPETYAPILLERKAARLRKSTGDTAYKSCLDTGVPPKQLFLRSLIRPSKMLILSPIVALMSSYIAVLYGFLYILFTTFTLVFEGQYGFSASASGLSFLGSGVGMLIDLAYVGTLSDRKIKLKLARKETPIPEDRLPLYLTIPGSLAIPAGLFIYGWSTDKVVHWIVPEIGNAVTGFGMIVILMCVQTYLVDAFLAHAASAVAACTVLRSLLGALLPLCGLQMYEKLGLGWGNSLLAFLALAMAPIPILFQTWGERLRTKWTINL
ncbi:hypothetical protein DTO013E5_4917 [Penicillium roqueforti]|uniref:Major facilitator superfamily n=1 Tax=Penicillium roqueforti (strain FM164) TaxID=1365484 RepID=W6QJL7_PENRF|nr:hypothetical protein DTO012A1_3456 [Penicillium roqueforti]CDM34404.1 Major facilitator superfamily [Penicillium roqueforti FM164]KAI2755401.1 hypothetical protein DTO013F2_1084 [Penicillium roqueforti]KAI2770721.1 hypothetical protein DTO012A8_4464 [Penicillium roqueforti]KAI3077001.1 hypothetical protein CBS147339_4971 [Penicillium roqueforti]